ncbi:hypothetical protein [Macrococcus equipercicus]|uniref:Uncharacterized protein n=1 Tax=Macrococcus equipercicus TaxID=69967 RepID=A0A9Q9BMD4_9STAP|nr:hypothetical protein [Macrococcus equipercicus]KAA1042313.1 hypothetical protein ERX35_000070 [Macrococcus equipercicus]UTH14208.1 hypothetical protein KFV11_02260 [Macrococcus equipercicus]
MPAKIKRNLVLTVILFIILAAVIYYIAMPDHPVIAILAISYLVLSLPISYADEYARYYKKNNFSPALVYKWQKRSTIPTIVVSLIYLVIIFSSFGFLSTTSGMMGAITGLTIGNIIRFFKSRSAYRKMLVRESRDDS